MSKMDFNFFIGSITEFRNRTYPIKSNQPLSSYHALLFLHLKTLFSKCITEFQLQATINKK